MAFSVVFFFMGLSLISIPGSAPVMQTHEKESVQDWTSGWTTIVGPAHAHAGTTGRPQTLCPIMGGPIDETAYVDHNGKRVYFCCAGCKDTFNKDPEKYIRGMESKGIELEKVPSR